MSKIIHYWHPLSFNCWRPEIVLHEKGLSHENVIINLRNKDSFPEEFVKANPRKQIPTLTHGNFSIYESSAICEYLDKAFPEPSLMPENDQDYGVARNRIAEFHQKFDNKQFLGSVFFRGKTKEDLKENIETLKTELRNWERYLEGREYFARTYSLADIIVWPHIKIYVEAFKWKFEGYPNLKAWYERINNRPQVISALKEFKNRDDHFHNKPEYEGFLEE